MIAVLRENGVRGRLALLIESESLANDGVAATVKSVSVGASLALMYPLPETPSPGDAFVVYDGCDHTLSTCGARFSNQSNFRGFPFVPPPQLAY